MLYPGRKVLLRGVEYVLPAVSLGQLRNGLLTQMKEHDALVTEGRVYDAMPLKGEVILLAFQRNYPDIDPNLVYDSLDATNIVELWLYVLGLSGFKPGEPAAADQKVEAEMKVEIPGTSGPSTIN